MALTDTSCKNAKGKEKAYKLSDSKGLFLQVMPNGGRYWRYKYRHLGKQKSYAIGVYPEVSLAEARERHRVAHKMVSDGFDPMAHKHDTKRQQILNSQNTFELIAIDWMKHNENVWSDNHAQTVKRRLQLDVFPKIGHKPIRDLDTPMLLEVIRAIEKRSAHEVARRVLQYCGNVFQYAIQNGKAEKDPSSSMKKALKPYKKEHFASMEAKQLPDFLNKLYSNQARMFPQARLGMELMMLTFVRTNELIRAEWSEFDFEKAQWLIPGARMKMGRDHIVPLSSQALNVLEQAKVLFGHGKWVFPSMRNFHNHMSDNTILVALRRMGYGGTHTGHGFRSLAMTIIMEELGYNYDIPDAQLAHSKGDDTRKAYDRTKFLAQRKVMMQDWSDYLAKIHPPVPLLED